jgi:hypothetical protein
VAEVTVALGGKMFRARIGGKWTVASYIVPRMAVAPKCRAADDLLLTADLHPDLDAARQKLSLLPTAELLRLAVEADQLTERAIALWYAVGTNPRMGSKKRASPRRW